ncbi:hypothetical protein V3C99_013506 [Haemonchus contortus]|uniref:Protein YIPF n=1 Tax=Haemonchus contortus TaxID=6289 RepID=A0A7I4Y0C6_HAECO|nr:Yip1 domain containing protein [Haemonchus contortus]CDJ96673.1 Yip1 domain containing protein [Haemonchus contortus]
MANLEFQPFQDGFSINSTNAQGFTGSIGDQNRLVHDAGDSVSASGRKSNFFSMEFYQQFFDVETDQVLKRVLNSIVPTNSNFILDYVHPMPDLWGPFWISVTLVFSIGVFGNIAQYIQNDGSPGEYGSDFRLVTSSATLVFLYVVVVPAILSTILWQRKAELQYALSDLLCAYGYSLSIFIPVSILWTLDVNWFRWLLIIAAVSLSGAVLVRALWPAFKSDPNKLIAYGSIFGVILLHFLLAFTFKVYFFDAVHPLSEKTVLTPEIKPANNSGMDNSNSQVLITEKVEKILSTRSPNTTNDVGKGPEKEAIIKSNNLKQNVTQEKEQTLGVLLNVTAAPPALQKSGS